MKSESVPHTHPSEIIEKLEQDRDRWRYACKASYRMNRRARSVELPVNRWWRKLRYRLDERGWWKLPTVPTQPWPVPWSPPSEDPLIRQQLDPEGRS